MKISIVVPVYNEENRINKAIEALNAYLPKKKIWAETIFVDDGSKDKTAEKIKHSRASFNYKLVSYRENQGKGFALKRGVKEAQGDYILLMDADMSTPIESLDKFLPLMEKGTPVILGTRKVKGAKVLVPQTKLRQKMGEFYTFLANVILGAKVSDFTCGFKCFSNESGKIIFSKLKTNRWSYDAEIIYLARKLGFEIKEVPVRWSNDDRTKVSLMKDSVESFVDLVKIRFYH